MQHNWLDMRIVLPALARRFSLSLLYRDRPSLSCHWDVMSEPPAYSHFIPQQGVFCSYSIKFLLCDKLSCWARSNPLVGAAKEVNHHSMLKQTLTMYCMIGSDILAVEIFLPRSLPYWDPSLCCQTYQKDKNLYGDPAGFRQTQSTQSGILEPQTRCRSRKGCLWGWYNCQTVGTTITTK